MEKMGGGSPPPALWQRRRSRKVYSGLISSKQSSLMQGVSVSSNLLIEHMADCVSVICTSGNDVMLVAVPQTEVSG